MCESAQKNLINRNKLAARVKTLCRGIFRMRTKFRFVVFSAALAGLMIGFVAGCSKPADVAGTPAPSITVGTVIDDSVVTTRVKSALLANPEVKSFDIAVVTRKGEVQLSGFVENQSQVDRAVEVARGNEGVVSVINQMTIKK